MNKKKKDESYTEKLFLKIIHPTNKEKHLLQLDKKRLINLFLLIHRFILFEQYF